MCKKLIYLVYFVLVLGLIGSASAALPQGWTSQDIGTTGGSADESGGTWTITADGLDIWGSSDGFHFVHVPMSGDGQMVARVVDIGTGTDGWARGGVMIRETLEPDSKHVTITLTAGEGSGKEFLCRRSTGGSSISSFGGTSVSPPLWLRLVREGNSITGYYSEDGANWVQQPDSTVIDGDLTTNPVELEMAADVYIGLCFTSHIEGVMRTYTFDNVSLKLPVIALNPTPADGAIHPDTWASLGWAPGHTAVSHDVYFGENFNDVNDGAEGTFQGNQASTFFVVGFPGFAYPDGLVPGTTYYWRIDEVNDAEPNSPWKGNVWSFMVPPKTAYAPDPADSAEQVDPNVDLSWMGGFGAKLHTVYFGDNFDDVSSAAGGLPQGTTTYTPGPLKLAQTYYWRVDEFDAIETYKGDVWSFTTEGAVGSPDPANGAVDVKQTQIITWSPGIYAASHQLYFGTDKDAVKNADTGSPEYKGSGNLGFESYEPGKLEWDTTYYWRVDEANNTNPDGPWTGILWSFTTANFLVVDDFESYNDLDPADPESNRIFNTWIDGYGSSNGSLVGYDEPPFAEKTIVHGGNQSMPFYYDNSVGYSEATLTLTYPRDWTEKGVSTLTIWFHGAPANAAETLYVALNGSAVVNHDNPNAAQVDKWTQWNINLQAFADQGVNLTNVNTIAIGLGNKNNPQAGGSGKMYFDDIRLYPPPQEPAP